MLEQNPNFYPTPKELVRKMFDKLTYEEQHSIRDILEPSAGKADLIENFKEIYKEKNYRYFSGYDRDKKVEDYLKFDAIELDDDLFSLLRGKGINVIDRDFLVHEPQKFYQLILANFPFDNGVKHLLHAISIQERIGGKIICLLNAESLRNPYSNDRKHLLKLLEQYKADIEYIDNAFNNAERKTSVSVALISVNIPMTDKTTMFEREFKRDHPEIEFDNFQSLVPQMNKLEALIFECDLIKKSGIELFKEKFKIDSLLEGVSLKSKLKICDDSYKNKELTINEFLNQTNFDFWNKFINETSFRDRLPSKLRNTFTCNMDKQRDITFNLENVRYFYEQLTESIPDSYEKTCNEVFDSLTYKSYYTDNEFCKNIWGYSGWKSNSCYKIKNKSIIRGNNGYYSYNLPDTLTDLIIIFENLSGVKDTLSQVKDGKKEYERILESIKRYEKNIDCPFMLIDSYKKGTIHLKYKDKKLVEAFNIIVGREKQWLPPDFGQKMYSDMSEKEKVIVKSFGLNIEEYNKLILTSSSKRDYLRLTS